MKRRIIWCLHHDSYMPKHLIDKCEAAEGEIAGDRGPCEPVNAELTYAP